MEQFCTPSFPMDLEQQTSAELQHHLDAIAKILYAEVNPDQIHSLLSKILKHLSEP
jgi:hypothetical protein